MMLLDKEYWKATVRWTILLMNENNCGHLKEQASAPPFLKKMLSVQRVTIMTKSSSVSKTRPIIRQRQQMLIAMKKKQIVVEGDLVHGISMKKVTEV